MKKSWLLMMILLMALTLCTTAFADDSAYALYEELEDLLFYRSSLTLNVTAEFSLDGSWFKTAEGTWMQDGNRSYRKLHLRSPKMDGTERVNGYTLVTEGENLFLMEEYTPGTYRTGTMDNRQSILRNTVESQQLLDLGRILASQADLLIGEGAVTHTDAWTCRIALDEDAPPLVHAVLNQAYQFAVKRYFDIDCDQLPYSYGPVYTFNSFGTVTQSILYCGQTFSLRKTEITVKTGEDGHLVHAEGSVNLYLNTAADGMHQLDITFTADVTDVGVTEVKPFTPEDYGVALVRGT